MKRKYIFTLLLCMLLSINAMGVNCFSMKALGGTRVEEIVDIDVTTDGTFGIPVQKISINGLSVNGRITVTDENFLVRIILKAASGDEFLILESYREINDTATIDFSNYCEETALLNGIQSDSIKIIAKGANVNLSRINYLKSPSVAGNMKKATPVVAAQSVKEEQISNIVDRINKYNRSHNKLWRAGITPLSRKSYKAKKQILGLTDDASTGGFEYYVEGILELGESAEMASSQSAESPYAEQFSWCNRHGVNWMSPNKSQGDTRSCVIFTTIGCVEAMTNLYFNQKLDLDLSEQELTFCSGLNAPNIYGVNMSPLTMAKPLGYLMNYGVCDEEAYPFLDDLINHPCKSDSVIPNELVKIGGYGSVNYESDDSLKKALINHGPLISGFKWKWPSASPTSSYFNINHAVVLVGYGKLQVGDTIYRYIDENGYVNGEFVVHEDDPRVGRTYWLYKNSYGLTQDEARGGYMCIIHYNNSLTMNPTYYCAAPISTMNYDDNDIVCEDRDGDGYYNWGIGPKPANAPSWVPDIEDGDDADISLGQMDAYGHFAKLPPGITMDSATTYAGNTTLNKHIGIVRGGILTVTGNLSMGADAKIRVCEGGCLVVDGGTIQSAKIEFVPGSTLIVKNNGSITMATGWPFEIPVGTIFKAEYGGILKNS